MAQGGRVRVPTANTPIGIPPMWRPLPHPKPTGYNHALHHSAHALMLKHYNCVFFVWFVSFFVFVFVFFFFLGLVCLLVCFFLFFFSFLFLSFFIYFYRYRSFLEMNGSSPYHLSLLMPDFLNFVCSLFMLH